MTDARLDVVIDPKGAKIGGLEAKRAIDGVGKSATGATGALNTFQKSLLITTAAGVFAASLGAATSAANAFKDSLAEVSTLLDDVPGQMSLISEEAKRQAVQFGSLPTAQAQAFYQIISAGAENAAEATSILTAANRLAVGGVTDVVTAVKGITAVMDSYGAKAGSVSDISDAFFVAMRRGKTNVGQLAREMGKVANLAEAGGVSVNALFAALATLTKTMPSTSEAATGLRAVLAAIIKPTGEAITEMTRLNKESRDLQINFSAAGLQKRGLADFLEDLKTITGQNVETLGKLFGGVEALTPVLALTGSGAAVFADILSDVDRKLGETDTAFRKIAESPGFATRQFKALVTVIGIEFGDAVSNVLLPATRFIIDNFEDIAKAATVAGVAMAAAFGPQIIALIGTQFVTAIGLATTGVRLFTAAIAANPLGAIAVAVTAAVSALVVFSDEIEVIKDGAVTLRDVFVTVWNGITDILGDAVGFWVDLFSRASAAIADSVFGWIEPVNLTMPDIGDAVKSGLNVVIGLFAGTINTIEENWRLIVPAVGSVMVKVTNAVVSTTEALINRVVNASADFLETVSTNTIRGINFLISQANRLPLLDFDLLIEPEFRENDFTFALGRVEDHFEGTATRIANNTQKLWSDALSTDFIGDFVRDFEGAVRKTATIRQSAKLPTPQTPGAPVQAGTGAENLADLTADQIATAQQLIDDFIAMSNEQFETSFAGGYATQLESMVEATRSAAFAMGVAFAEVFGPGGSLQRGLADSAARAIVFGDDLGQSITNLSKRIAADLIAKFIETQLAMATVGNAARSAEAVAQAATLATNRALTADALASQAALAAGAATSGAAINAAYTPASITASIATSGGAATTATTAYTTSYAAMKAVAASGSVPAFAQGGAFTNRIVDKPTAFPLGVMGEAGPEAILPLSRNSRGQLGVVAAQTSTPSGPVTFAPVVRINIDRVQGANQEVGAEISRQVNRELEGAFNKFLSKEQRPGGRLNRQRVV